MSSVLSSTTHPSSPLRKKVLARFPFPDLVLTSVRLRLRRSCDVMLNVQHHVVEGAFHGSEVPFVFYDEFELVGDERMLSANMVQYWANFAHAGNPNVAIPSQSPAVPLPEWALYNETSDSYLIIETPTMKLPPKIRRKKRTELLLPR